MRRIIQGCPRSVLHVALDVGGETTRRLDGMHDGPGVIPVNGFDFHLELVG